MTGMQHRRRSRSVAVLVCGVAASCSRGGETAAYTPSALASARSTGGDPYRPTRSGVTILGARASVTERTEAHWRFA